jgi:hypothetical protein
MVLLRVLVLLLVRLLWLADFLVGLYQWGRLLLRLRRCYFRRPLPLGLRVYLLVRLILRVIVLRFLGFQALVLKGDLLCILWGFPYFAKCNFQSLRSSQFSSSCNRISVSSY